MAIMYVSNQIIGRGTGRSAVAAAAYRRGALMVDERQGRSCNYEAKANVSFSEITIPKDSPAWVGRLLNEAKLADNPHAGSAALWNLVEEIEKRSDAQLAREMLLALPVELSLEQNTQLVRDYATSVLSNDGLIVDWSIHNEEGNPHVHLMMPMRLVEEDGFGLKRKPLITKYGKVVTRKNGPKKGQPFYKLVIGEKEDLARWKQGWAEIQNLHLERAGHSIRVDHRSYAEQGLTIQGGNHLGPAASAIRHREGTSYQFQVQAETAEFNAKQVLNNPENIVRKVSHTRAIFSENDLVREAGKYLDSYEDIEAFRACVMSSPSLVKLVDEGLSEHTGRVVTAARYTTHETLDIETDLVGRVQTASAKLVLIGDAEQLQSIEAGAPFRAIVEQAGCSTISTVRRQQEEWMCEASKDFAEHRTASAIQAYSAHGHVHHHQTAQEAKEALVRDWVAANGPHGSQIILAHRRLDAAELNYMVHNALVSEGTLVAGEVMETSAGEREFSIGERIIFKNNDRALGVKNGMLGTVTRLDEGGLSLRLDQGRELQLRLSDYNHIDYGYAVTVHKSQGVTVDKAFVYGSKTMDRHLTYVAMTRHRHEVGFYSSKQEFGDQSQIPHILAKARMQRSALEFLENREHAPQLDKAAWMEAFYERQKEKLARLTARFDQIVAKVLPQRSVKTDLQDAAQSDHTQQSKISVPTPTSASEHHRFSYSQMSSKDASELKASLLRKEVVSEAIQRDVSVVRAHKSLVRSAGYVSPQFQAEIEKIPVEKFPSLDMNKIGNLTRLNDRGLELMARAVSTLDGALNKALSRHVASVNKVVDTLSKPLPELSIRAQNFVIDCESTTDKTQLKSLYQALGPKAREVRLEIGDYMTGLRNRVEVTQSVEIVPKLAAALLPIKPTALNAASFKASITIKQGLSATLRRGIDLTR